jgi:hypothetical protein
MAQSTEKRKSILALSTFQITTLEWQPESAPLVKSRATTLIVLLDSHNENAMGRHCLLWLRYLFSLIVKYRCLLYYVVAFFYFVKSAF